MKLFRSKKRLLIFIILLGLGLYGVACLSPIHFYHPDPDSSTPNNVTITGHRGAAGLAPENTLASVKKALDMGLPRIEIDVQQTADSIVIVLHDLTLDRTTNGSGHVRDLPYDEIAGMNAGAPGELVPSLEQVIQLINGQSTLIIELKEGDAYYPGIERRVLKLIRMYEAASWCIVHSFEDDVLEKIHSLAPDIRLHKLFVAKLPFLPLGVDKSFGGLDLDKYAYCQEISVNYRFATKRLLRAIHDRKQKLNVWTVNDPKQMQRLIDLGVDGIITDRPDLIEEIGL